jgi:hypothetical protein
MIPGSGTNFTYKTILIPICNQKVSKDDNFFSNSIKGKHAWRQAWLHLGLGYYEKNDRLEKIRIFFKENIFLN